LHPVAGNTDNIHPLSLDLLLGQENIDCAAIARLDHHPNAGWILPSLLRLFLVVEIGNQIVYTVGVPDQSTGVCGAIDKNRASAALRARLVSNHTVYLPTLQ
jgi:hypothetical protein